MSKKRRKDITKYGPTFFYMGIDPTIRKDRGWTQKELAYMTGGEISVRTIQNYENGITEIGAKNLLMLSAILETTPSTLLKTPVEAFDYEFDNIHQFHSSGENKGMPNIDAPKYKFNENLGDSRNIGYFILKEDSHILGVPKGAKVIFDVDLDHRYLFTWDKTELIGIIKEYAHEDELEFHVTKFIYAPHSRRIQNYIYFDRKGKPVQIGQSEFEEILFAEVKKVIIEY